MRRILFALILLASASAHANFREFTDIPVDPGLETRIRSAAEKSLADFPKLTSENLAISVIDLTNPALLARADYHGDATFYPASVIKLFFMYDIFALRKESLPDVPRALKEMIKQSDNDATAFIVEVESDTTGGPELQGRGLRRFIAKRRAINNRFKDLGYDISAMMKTWSFGPFGRERQLLGKNRENRNRFTANSVSALLHAIVRRHDAMMDLLQRDADPANNDEGQIALTLPEGSKNWSKAGWTSEVRHDSAYVELPDGRKLIVVVLTRGVSDDNSVVRNVAKNFMNEMQ